MSHVGPGSAQATARGFPFDGLPSVEPLGATGRRSRRLPARACRWKTRSTDSASIAKEPVRVDGPFGLRECEVGVLEPEGVADADDRIDREAVNRVLDLGLRAGDVGRRDAGDVRRNDRLCVPRERRAEIEAEAALDGRQADADERGEVFQAGASVIGSAC